jgi:hypothetical protein
LIVCQQLSDKQLCDTPQTNFKILPTGFWIEFPLKSITCAVFAQILSSERRSEQQLKRTMSLPCVLGMKKPAKPVAMRVPREFQRIGY